MYFTLQIVWFFEIYVIIRLLFGVMDCSSAILRRLIVKLYSGVAETAVYVSKVALGVKRKLKVVRLPDVYDKIFLKGQWLT